MPPFDFPFQDFLQENPEAAFFSSPGFQQQAQRSPQRRSFFENQFRTIHNQFQGQLGQMVRGGQLPTAQFTDFIDAFDFNNQFFQTPPGLRGGFGGSRFRPPTRTLFGF
jgi:hypothetical protein